MAKVNQCPKCGQFTPKHASAIFYHLCPPRLGDSAGEAVYNAHKLSMLAYKDEIMLMWGKKYLRRWQK